NYFIAIEAYIQKKEDSLVVKDLTKRERFSLKDMNLKELIEGFIKCWNKENHKWKRSNVGKLYCLKSLENSVYAALEALNKADLIKFDENDPLTIEVIDIFSKWARSYLKNDTIHFLK
ncbi:1324_t:CDS:2, partial [Gigaspora margarita]